MPRFLHLQELGLTVGGGTPAKQGYGWRIFYNLHHPGPPQLKSKTYRFEFYPSTPADCLYRSEISIIGGSRNRGIITPSTRWYYTAADKKKSASPSVRASCDCRRNEKNLHPVG